MRSFIDNILRERNDVLAIVLFGSAARGREKPFPESDLDVLVIAEKLNKNLFYRRIENLKYKENAEIIEDIWLTPQELFDGIEGAWGVILDAIADGIVIYDKSRIIERARKVIKQKYRRIGRIWSLIGNQC